MFQIFPVLKIHVWGGLGSQLYATSLFYDLKLRFPNRRIVLVLHSSGVTKRYSEIEVLFPELTCYWVDDFEGDDLIRQKRVFLEVLFTFIRQILRNVTKKLGIVASLNTDHEYRKVRFWVLQIRGHYSHRSIALDHLKVLSKKIEMVESANPPKGILGVHYRLGDLLNLQDKNPIDSERLVKSIRNVLNEREITELALFSDSPAVALDRINEISMGINVNAYSLSAIDTLKESLSYEIFIGTNSKISLWIAYLRFFHSAFYGNVLPKELESTYRYNLPETNQIKTY